MYAQPFFLFIMAPIFALTVIAALFKDKLDK